MQSRGTNFVFGLDSAFAGLASLAAGFSSLPAGGFASFAGAGFASFAGAGLASSFFSAGFASAFFWAAGFGAGAAGFGSGSFFTFATRWSFGSIRFFKYAGTISAALASV